MSASLLLVGCGNTSQKAVTATTSSQGTKLIHSGDMDGVAPLYSADAEHAIKGQYIVVFKDDADMTLKQELSAQNAAGLVSSLGLDAQGITVQQMYDQALQGFAAKISAQNLGKLRFDKRVAYIEQDSTVYASGSQGNATWGLDRIDQTSLPLNRTFRYPNTASNVTAYVVDSGIRTSHNDFGGRARWGGNFSGDGKDYDCSGHGTHVAGTIGGRTWGVAKNVKLVAVKVLNCAGRGSTSGMVAGMNWIARSMNGPSVANMSIYSPPVRSLESAIRNAVSRGLVMVVSANNQSTNACYSSPARMPEVVTVGATSSSDTRASFSNYGSCVTLFAPGVNITSASASSNTGTSRKGGTSMASPHGAGAAALVLGANPNLSPAQVKNKLIADSAKNKVRSAGSGSPNRLLYVGNIGGNGGGTPAPNPGGNTGGNNGGGGIITPAPLPGGNTGGGIIRPNPGGNTGGNNGGGIITPTPLPGGNTGGGIVRPNPGGNTGGGGGIITPTPLPGGNTGGGIVRPTPTPTPPRPTPTPTNPNITLITKPVTSNNWSKFIEASKSRIVILEFGAPGCASCVKLEKALTERVKREGGKTWVMGKTDGTVHKDLAARFGATLFPTTFAFVNGKKVSQFDDFEGWDKWLNGVIAQYGNSGTKPPTPTPTPPNPNPPLPPKPPIPAPPKPTPTPPNPNPPLPPKPPIPPPPPIPKPPQPINYNKTPHARYMAKADMDTRIVHFFDQSQDADGKIVAYAWNFGDGTTSTLKNPVKRFNCGAFTVTLLVTDNQGARKNVSANINFWGHGSCNPNFAFSF